MSGPINLSAADFTAVLEAGELEPTGMEPAGAEPAEAPAVDAEAARAVSSEGAGAGPAASPGPAPPRAPAPIPDPFDDADALEELEHEVVTLAAHIEAATYRLLVLIREFDRRRGWELGGHRSCAHWLHYTTGLDLGAAREKVRAARALERLPETSEAMARGELSFSKVRALTRVATPECECELLEVARVSTTAGLERFVREWRSVSRGDEIELERMRYASRTFSVFPDDEGMYVVRGKLPAEVGALLMRAVEAASDALFPSREARAETTPKQRRADALGLVAERAMAAGFGDGVDRSVSAETRVSGSRTESADKGVSAEIPVSGTRAERYQVFLHVEPDTLRAGGGAGTTGGTAGGTAPGSSGGVATERAVGGRSVGGRDGAGRSHLEDGTRLSAETARRLCCDVAMVTVARNGDGNVLDIGRRSRVIPPAIDRALKIRDRGCRFPGCTVRFTDGHHVVHWADGGETKLTNLVSLCVYHHRKLHEGGWRLRYDADADIPTFIDPRGHVRYDARPRPRRSPRCPPAPLFGESLAVNGRRAAADHVPLRAAADHVASGARAAEALAERNCARGVTPDGEKLRSRYRRRADVPWEILAPALEALDEAHFGE